MCSVSFRGKIVREIKRLEQSLYKSNDLIVGSQEYSYCYAKLNAHITILRWYDNEKGGERRTKRIRPERTLTFAAK